MNGKSDSRPPSFVDFGPNDLDQPRRTSSVADLQTIYDLVKSLQAVVISKASEAVDLANQTHKDLRRLERRFDGLEKRFDGLEKRFDGLEERVDGLATKVDALEGKVDDLSTQFKSFRRSDRAPRCFFAPELTNF